MSECLSVLNIKRQYFWQSRMLRGHSSTTATVASDRRSYYGRSISVKRVNFRVRGFHLVSFFLSHLGTEAERFIPLQPRVGNSAFFRDPLVMACCIRTEEPVTFNHPEVCSHWS